jgi:hypothetical protein
LNYYVGLELKEISINNKENKNEIDFLDEKDAICAKIFRIRNFSLFMIPFIKNSQTNFKLIIDLPNIDLYKSKYILINYLRLINLKKL